MSLPGRTSPGNGAQAAGAFSQPGGIPGVRSRPCPAGDRAKCPSTLAGNKFDPHPWWNVLRDCAANTSLSASDLAAYYSRLTPNVLQLYETSTMTSKDAGFLLEHGMGLFNGKPPRGGEEVFRLILEGKAAPGNGNMMQAIRANACLPARAGAAPLPPGRPRRSRWRIRPWRCAGGRPGAHRPVVSYNMSWEAETRSLTGGLAGDIVRQLREMRVDPAAVPLPTGSGW